MKKIIMCLILMLAMFSVQALAMDADLSNFEFVKNNTESGLQPFVDVTKDKWYSKAINDGYAYGILKGNEGEFKPTRTLLGSEAVTIAAKINAIYLYGENYESEINKFDISSANWYDKYLTYCKAHLLLGDELDSAMLRPLNRAEMVHVWYKVIGDLPKAANNVISLPDVNSTVSYWKEIEAFYNAGITKGSDDIGTFKPYNTILRAEAASMLINIIEPTRRSTGRTYEKPIDLTVYTSSKPLWWGNIEIYGLYIINGEYYLPLDLLYLYGGYEYGNDVIRYNDEQNENRISIKWKLKSPEALPYYTVLPPDGKVVGKAQQSSYILEGPYWDDGIKNSIVTLGGRYPMVKVSALSKYVDVAIDNTGVYVTSDKALLDSQTIPLREPDKIGEMTKVHIKNSDRDTLLGIHDNLVNLMTYSYDTYEKNSQFQWHNNRTVDIGMGVCSDYAKAFFEMCIRAGIPCFYQTGWAGGSHAWNAVYIDDTWKYVDVTWDDPVAKNPILRWDYFLIDGNTLMTEHCWKGLDYNIKESYNPEWEKLDSTNIKTADEFRKCLLVKMYHKETPIKLKGVYGGMGVMHLQNNWWQATGRYEGGYWIFDIEYY